MASINLGINVFKKNVFLNVHNPTVNFGAKGAKSCGAMELT